MKKGKIAIILIVLIILGGLSYIFLVDNKKPKKIISKTLDNTYNSIIKFYDDVKEKISIDSDITISSDMEELENLKDTKLSLSSSVDTEKKYSDVSVTLEKGENKTTVSALLRNEKIYLSSKDLFDKNVLVDDYAEDITKIFNSDVTKENYKYLIESIKDALKKSINDKYITKKDNELSYKLDKTGIKETLDSVNNTLKANSKFIEILKKLNKDYKEEEYFNEVDIEEIENETIEFKLSTKGLFNEFEYFKLIVNDKEIFTINGNVYEYKSIDEEIDKNIEIKLIKVDEEKTTLTLKTISSGVLAEVNGTLNNTNNLLSGELEYSLKYEDNETKVVMKYNENNKVEFIDINDDFVKLSELSDSDKNTIENNVYKRFLSIE